ncbi:hypothetical protein [Rhabdothermincola salaria]|uniref:hypothetical protein n=1 Tax=Rhabdothermincola salaria TaxID=2903142 RepID=UPI001E4A6A40|nr:hypothetical protein [Rhabdothermincola salaria]MCD9623311.1 hypothetical protein [Rhabdothermincola salaria]
MEPPPSVTVHLPDEVAGPPSTLIGPTGTAPELELIVPADRAVPDSASGRTHVLPLFVAGVVLVVVVTVVLIRARRTRRPDPGSAGQLPDGSEG